MTLNPVFTRLGGGLGQAMWTTVDVPSPYASLKFPTENTTYIVNVSTSGKSIGER